MKLIALSKGKFAKINSKDFNRINKYHWSYAQIGYALRGGSRNYKRYYIYMHRFILGLGPADKVKVDHINGDKLDNRRCNLRICNQSQNIANSDVPKTNTSGYKNIYWYKKRNYWYIKFRKYGKEIKKEGYRNLQDAIRIRNQMSNDIWGEFAYKY